MTHARQAGGFSRALQGFVECGDAFLIAPCPGGELAVAVVDGLGHGAEAGRAAAAAVEVIRRHLALPAVEILRQCDVDLRQTRGAALGVLKVAEDGQGEFCGIGNIEVRGLCGRQPSVFCLAGIVGHNVRALRAQPLAMQAGDVYCMHSDGVSSRGALRDCLPGPPELVARRIVESWGKSHDDATAVVLGYGAGDRLDEAGAVTA